jgi:hypothetical protein
MTNVGRLVGLCLVVVIPACTSGGSKSASPTTAPSAATTASAPSPDRVASVTFTGDAVLSGAVGDTSVRCNFPSLDGLSIAVLGQPGDATSLARIALLANKVRVIVSLGDGPDYHERTFEGTRVSSFDATKGAQVDSPLKEVVPPDGSRPGRVGMVTAIKGTVACGDQTPGSSTVTFTGATPSGNATAAKLDPARVECYVSPHGDEVVASGIATIGTTRTLIGLGLQSDGSISVDETLPTTTRHYFADGTATVTASGGTVRADVVEQGVVSSGAHRLHVEGDLVCGLHAAG